MVTIAVATSGRPSQSAEHKQRARVVGGVVAELGCDLLTGSGYGGMEIVARSFCETPGRSGRSIGVMPGTVSGFNGAKLGTITSYSLAPKEGYPIPWIEVPIFTHLPGTNAKGSDSRNFLNVASGDVIVILPGGDGTQAEFEIAAGLGKPIVAFVGKGSRIGAYSVDELAPHAEIVDNGRALRKALRKRLLPLALPRPTYTALHGVYKTDPTQIHSYSMQFPNTCAIRMSEVLAQAVNRDQGQVQVRRGQPLSARLRQGAEDLAGVLRKADAFGVYDYGFRIRERRRRRSTARRGLSPTSTYPGFPGEGHIDLWDGAAPAGDAYWNADPIWFWKLAP